VMWVIPAIFQPTWVQDCLIALQAYDSQISVRSAMDALWNPYQIPAALLLLGTSWVLWRQRKREPETAVFASCLALSLSTWALVIPVVGMFHVLPLFLAAIWLLAYYQHTAQWWYRMGVTSLLIVYGLGAAGFLIGLSNPNWYGLHITLSEFTYRTLLPIVMTVLALPVCLPVRHSENIS